MSIHHLKRMARRPPNIVESIRKMQLEAKPSGRILRTVREQMRREQQALYETDVRAETSAAPTADPIANGHRALSLSMK